LTTTTISISVESPLWSVDEKLKLPVSPLNEFFSMYSLNFILFEPVYFKLTSIIVSSN